MKRVSGTINGERITVKVRGTRRGGTLLMSSRFHSTKKGAKGYSRRSKHKGRIND